MSGKLIWRGSTLLAEQPESGAISYADRTVLTRVYRGPYWLCRASALPQGAYGTGEMLGWVVASCEVKREERRIGKLSIRWEPGGEYADELLPCDDYKIENVELYPRVENNKLFRTIKFQTVALAYEAVLGGTSEVRNAAMTKLFSWMDSEDYELSDQGYLGATLVDKLTLGEQTYYLAGWKLQWIFYSYTLPVLHPGGVIQAPFGPGNIPDSLPESTSWLRLADGAEPAGVNGSMHKITRNWLGGPNGHWDEDLYE